MVKPHFQFPKRRGITLVEVVVVIVILVVLASLFAPSVRTSGIVARKFQCLSNIRNIGLAHQNFASANEGRLPQLTSMMKISSDNGEATMSVGWPILILPALDNSALYRMIKQDSVVTNGTATLPATTKVSLEVFTCPNDPEVKTSAGGFSYVVNAGFISSEVWGNPETPTLFHQPYLINWKGSTTAPFRSTDGTPATGDPSPIDMEIALASGVYWRIVGDTKEPAYIPLAAKNEAFAYSTPAIKCLTSNRAGYNPSIDYVSNGDGTSTTLMLVENLNAGLWFDTDVNLIGFGIKIPVNSSNAAPSVGTTSPNGEFTSVLSLNTDFPGSTFNRASSGSWINEQAHGVRAPRPSSKHVGGVNTVMVDGSARFLNENMDHHVYARLMTSNGTAFQEDGLKQ